MRKSITSLIEYGISELKCPRIVCCSHNVFNNVLCLYGALVNAFILLNLIIFFKILV